MPIAPVKRLDEAAIFFREWHALALFQPTHEAWHGRERDETIERWHFAAQILDNLLDQKIAESDAGKPALTIGNGIEDCGTRMIEGNRRPILDKQRCDCLGDGLRQGNFDEDQRLIDQSRMEKAVTAPVERIDPAAKVRPITDFMHGFVADD